MRVRRREGVYFMNEVPDPEKKGKPVELDLPTEEIFAPLADNQDPEKGLIGVKNEEDDEKEAADEKKDKGGNRTKGNQRWMKLRTTVQLSGAISHTIQKSKPPLKREDSFLKRFSTRQLPELEETVDASEDGGTFNENNPTGLSRLFWKKQRRKRNQNKAYYTVVNPDGNFYFYWLLVVSVCVLYNLWTLIVRQAFPELQAIIYDFWWTCDIVTDMVFLLDIIVQLRTGYLEQGLMVYDSSKLAGHYGKSKKFFLDLLALFPLELLQFNIGVKPMLRFPRFLKIYRLYQYYYIVESRTVYPNVWRVVNLIHILLILAHWFGCFYFLLSEAEGFQGDWVYPYRPGEYATVTRKYLGSLYWSTLTLTTIGDLPTPETNAEYIFTIVSYLIGVFIFATIVGQVGNVITNRNANRLEFERLLDGAKTYMRHHKVPGGMKRRVLRWYDYSWSRGRIQGGGDINTALGLLPDKLKTELALHVNLSVLKKVTIFQECQPEFLHDLVLKMKAYIFTPGDMICRKGEVAREMFIIADGILEVMSETGRVLTTMKAGDFFGEIGILNLDGLNKRTADVRSVGYSELFSLSREDVLTAMKDYPEAQEILQTLGRKRLMEARNLNRAWKASGSPRNTEDIDLLFPFPIAQQKKDGKAAALNQQKTEKTDSDGEGINKNSIVDKLKGDVMELRNVFKKGGRAATRVKSDGVEIELSKCHMESETVRGTLSRGACAYEEDSHDEDSQQSQKPLGAGLPLMQRLKLLKEKEKEEQQRKINEEEASSLTPSSSDKREIDPALPLLQRILQLKPKDEKKSGTVVQSTANMAAEVLATTVRTQMKSPNTLTLKPSLKTDDAAQGSSLEPKGTPEVHKKILFKKDEVFEKEFSKKEIEKRNTSEGDKESWVLIKKAVLVPNNSVDVHEKRGIETKKKEKEETLPAITSTTDSSPEASLNQQLEKSLSIEMRQKFERLFPRSTDERFWKHKDTDGLTVHSDDESRLRTTPSTSVSRMYKRRKIYHSIDDLSPEYSGLPFVKKLKILNERQKLAELEKETPNESLARPYCSHITTDSQIIRTRLDIEHSQRKASLNQRQLHLATSDDDGQDEACGIDKTYFEGGISISSETSNILDSGRTNINAPLLSPESNETLERRKLKSILKKLSSVSTPNPTGVPSEESPPPERKHAADRKLLREPTVQGYAARHSKFTKSVTLHRNTTEDAPSMADSLTGSFSQAGGYHAHSLDDSTVRSKYSTWTDSSRSLEDSQLTEISTFDNNAIPPAQPTEHGQQVTQIKQSVGQVQKWEYFQSEYESNQIKLKDVEHSEISQPMEIGLPKEIVTALFSEIRKAIDEHMVQIECNYINKYTKLEYEYKKREETISQLQKKIEELENEAAQGAEYDDDGTERNESEEDDNSRVSHRGIPVPMYPLQPADIASLDLLNDDDDSSDGDTDVFRNDWEIHLLAEEMEKQEERRERATSFDLSQLGQEETDRCRARWSSASEPVTVRRVTQRSVSINNIETRLPQRRRTHFSYNGTYTSVSAAEQLKKPASFSNGFS